MFGRPLKERFPTDAVIDIRSKRGPSDYFTAGSFPVVSSKLKAVLDKFEVRGEFLPVTLVRRRDGIIQGDWFCFNAMQVADCFDRENSQFTLEQQFATDITRVAIVETACEGAPLTLASNTIPTLLVVRNDLAEAIASSECKDVLHGQRAFMGHFSKI